MEMSTSDFNNGRGDNSRWFQIAVCLGLLLGVLTTILIAVTLVQVNKGLDDNKDTPSAGQLLPESDEDRITRMYTGFFRTADEQRELESTLILSKKFSVNTSIDIPEVGFYNNVSQCTTGARCSSEPFAWTNVIFNNVYHGCCYSLNTYTQPGYMKDTKGKLRKIAQFDRKKQHIQEETCNTIPDCDLCVCTQMPNYISLVCDDSGGNYSVGGFIIPGCCKCVNS